MSISDFKVGQKVKTLRDIIDPPCENSPGGRLAKRGEFLIIRAINPSHSYPISVSHPEITDKSFGVEGEEIEIIQEGE